jgi:hypothetical protein
MLHTLTSLLVLPQLFHTLTPLLPQAFHIVTTLLPHVLHNTKALLPQVFRTLLQNYILLQVFRIVVTYVITIIV